MNTKRKHIDISLSIKPEQEPIVSTVQKEIIQENLSLLEPIKENDINISTVYVFDMGDKLEASIFIRNGLESNINFDKVPLELIDSEGKIVATKIFHLREVGTIPSKSARPWKIYFNKDTLQYIPKDLQECKVIFDNNIQAISTVQVELENEYTDITLNGNIREFLNNLEPLKKAQVDINTYDAKVEDENKIVITLVIRNGADKQIEIQKIPITIYDSNNKIIISNSIQLEKLKVHSKKARVYNIVFNFDKEKYTEYDFKNLSVSLKKE